MNKEMNNLPVVMTGVGGILAIMVSLSLSWQFAASLGDGLVVSVMMVVAIMAWNIPEFFGVFWILYAKAYQNAFLFLIACLLFMGGIAINITAGLSFMAQTVADKESEILRQSDIYQAALQARKNALARAENMAVSDSEYKTAVQELSAAKKEAENFYNQNATNTNGTVVGTVRQAINRYGCNGYYGSLCAQADIYKTRAYEAGKIISAYKEYKNSLSYADELAAKPLPKATVNTALPGFVTISKVTGIEIDAIRAFFSVFFGVAIEILAVTLTAMFGYFVNQSNRKTHINIPIKALMGDQPQTEVYATAQKNEGFGFIPPKNESKDKKCKNSHTDGESAIRTENLPYGRRFCHTDGDFDILSVQNGRTDGRTDEDCIVIKLRDLMKKYGLTNITRDEARELLTGAVRFSNNQWPKIKARLKE